MVRIFLASSFILWKRAIHLPFIDLKESIRFNINQTNLFFFFFLFKVEWPVRFGDSLEVEIQLSRHLLGGGSGTRSSRGLLLETIFAMRLSSNRWTWSFYVLLLCLLHLSGGQVPDIVHFWNFTFRENICASYLVQ